MTAVINATARVTITASQESSERITVLHYTAPTDHVWTTSELNTLCLNLWNAISIQLKACNVSSVNFVSVDAVDMGTVNGNIGSYSIPQPAPGTRASGPPQPANVAACVSWRTGRSGRSFRGRSYFYGLGNNDTVNSTLGNPYGSALATLAGLIGNFTNSGGVSVRFTVASIKLLLATVVNSFIIDNLADSMRRRLLSRGA